METRYHVIGVRRDLSQTNTKCSDKAEALACYESQCKYALKKEGPSLWLVISVDENKNPSLLKSTRISSLNNCDILRPGFEAMIRSALGLTQSAEEFISSVWR